VFGVLNLGQSEAAQRSLLKKLAQPPDARVITPLAPDQDGQPFCSDRLAQPVDAVECVRDWLFDEEVTPGRRCALGNLEVLARGCAHEDGVGSGRKRFIEILE